MTGSLQLVRALAVTKSGVGLVGAFVNENTEQVEVVNEVALFYWPRAHSPHGVNPDLELKVAPLCDDG